MTSRPSRPRRSCAAGGEAAALKGDAKSAVVNPYESPTSANVILRAAHRNGAELMNALLAHLRRHVRYPPHAAVAHALWLAHTHAMPEWDETPRLAFISRPYRTNAAIYITSRLVPRPLQANGIGGSALLKAVAADQPTVIFDSVDTFDSAAGLRMLFRANRRGGSRMFVAGGKVVSQSIFCALAFAGIRDLSDMSRVIAIRGHVQGDVLDAVATPDLYTDARHRQEADALREALAAFAATVEFSEPAFPVGVINRDADNWRPLLCVAESVGGRWPGLARRACAAFVTASTREAVL